MDNVLSVLHLLEMICVDLPITDNVLLIKYLYFSKLFDCRYVSYLNLFSDPFLYLGMMNKAMNNNTQSGGGGIESLNKRELTVDGVRM